MGFQQVTLSAAATTGYLITLTNPAGAVSVNLRAEAWFRVTGPGTAPTAPASTPAPASGAQATWIHGISGEAFNFGYDASMNGAYATAQDTVQYIEVFSIGAGDFVVSAH